eukprot:scaffold7689_cov72-Skeletonema_dohrnii-CCMP3373.AAC.2
MTHHICHLNYKAKCCGGEIFTLDAADASHGGSSNTTTASQPQQSFETSSNDTLSNESDPTTTHPLRNKGGRPNGVTKAAQEERAKKVIIWLQKSKPHNRSQKEANYGKELTLHCIKKLWSTSTYNMSIYPMIPSNKRGNLTVTAMGPKSPLAKLEPFLVEIVNQAQEAGQPVSPSHFIEIVNSLLEESAVKEARNARLMRQNV